MWRWLCLTVRLVTCGDLLELLTVTSAISAASSMITTVHGWVIVLPREITDSSYCSCCLRWCCAYLQCPTVLHRCTFCPLIHKQRQREKWCWMWCWCLQWVCLYFYGHFWVCGLSLVWVAFTSIWYQLDSQLMKSSLQERIHTFTEFFTIGWWRCVLQALLLIFKTILWPASNFFFFFNKKQS